MVESPFTTIPTTDDEKMKGAIAYVLSWLTGIIVLLIGGENRVLKFHAMQSIVFGVLMFIVGILVSWTCIGAIIPLLMWVYTLYGAYLVYTGKDFRIPYIADLVQNNLMK